MTNSVDYNGINEQLSKRSNDQLKTELNAQEYKTLFALAPNELGVIRNGGRRGTRWAPKCLMANILKLNKHSTNAFHMSNVCESDENSFEQMVTQSYESIASELKSKNLKNLFHIGGGHDHIYPLLKALGEIHKKITVINIDAHLDTRTDELHHSGTPFRRFDQDYKGEFKLIQIGIHNFANSSSTFSKLQNGSMQILTCEELLEKTNHTYGNLKEVFKNDKSFNFNDDEFVVLSLDCDAISSDIMEAVSAVNHQGLPLFAIKQIIDFYYEVKKEQQKVFGIYEYNPIFDNLSNKGARALAGLVYPLLSK